MSASTNPIHALVARLNERRNITRADVEAVLDTLIEQKFAEYVRDMQSHGVSPHEIESSMEIQTEMAREWKAAVLHEVVETFGPTMH
jgi:hypothetical protein